MSDPRSLDEAFENTTNGLRITEHYGIKCECGHDVTFHHLTGLCKGSMRGCQCEDVRPVELAREGGLKGES